MVLTFLSVCSTVLVLSIHLREALGDVPPWVERLLTLTSYKKPTNNVSPDNIQDVDNNVLQLVEAEELTGNHFVSKREGGCETKVFSDILHELKKITKKMEKKANEDMLQEKWREVAIALNKMLGYILLVCLVIMVFTCFGMWLRP